MQQERGKKSGRSTQKPEKLGDHGKEDSSTKGGTRRKKGYQRFSFSSGVCRKRQIKKTKGLRNRKNRNARESQLIGQFGWSKEGRRVLEDERG